VWFKSHFLFSFQFPFHLSCVIYVSVSFPFWRIFSFPFHTIYFRFSSISVLNIFVSVFIFILIRTDAVIIRNKHIRHEKIKHEGLQNLASWLEVICNYDLFKATLTYFVISMNSVPCSKCNLCRWKKELSLFFCQFQMTEFVVHAVHIVTL